MSEHMSVHEGHRERLKESFLKNGLSSFNDINALELLLFYSIPRRDTNALAHALIDRFGSLNRVFEAKFEQLLEVPGIGENTAALICLVPEIMKKSAISAVENVKYLRTRDELGNYFVPRFMNEQNEVFLMVCLNNNSEIISCMELCEGDMKSVHASPRKIAEIALRMNAAAVVIAHNHPHGIAAPSNEDVMCTRKIKQALALVDIELHDHVIVSGEKFTSMAFSGYLTGFGNGFM